jgi:hypothetical protein
MVPSAVLTCGQPVTCSCSRTIAFMFSVIRCTRATQRPMSTTLEWRDVRRGATLCSFTCRAISVIFLRAVTRAGQSTCSLRKEDVSPARARRSEGARRCLPIHGSGHGAEQQLVARNALDRHDEEVGQASPAQRLCARQTRSKIAGSEHEGSAAHAEGRAGGATLTFSSSLSSIHATKRRLASRSLSARCVCVSYCAQSVVARAFREPLQ